MLLAMAMTKRREHMAPSLSLPPVSKWALYSDKINRLVGALKRKDQKGESDSPAAIATMREIREFLQILQNENSHHVRHNMIEQNEDYRIATITCSKCGEIESETDQLYFCDVPNCNRCYHLKCLEPPLSITKSSINPKVGWSCYQCRCILECLNLINKSRRTNYVETDEVFRELVNITNTDSIGKSLPKSTKGSDSPEQHPEVPQKRGRRKGQNSNKPNESLIAFTDEGPILKYTATTQWGKTYQLVKRLVNDIVRCNHVITVFSTQTQSDSIVLTDELSRNLERLRNRKLAVRQALHEMCSYNSSHMRYPELEITEDDDMVDVGNVNCSMCGLPDTETNDIFICDRKGCCRAYHALCLDPPLKPTDISDKPEEDWFCWECRCLDDCLMLINESTGSSFEELSEVYADVDYEQFLNVDGEESGEDDHDYSPNVDEAGGSEGDNSIASDDEEQEMSENEPCEISEDSSEVSEEEVQKLIAEAGEDLVVPSINQEDCRTGSFISQRLRKKVSQSGQNVLPVGMVSLDALSPSVVDLNFPVARVKGGRIIPGLICSIEVPATRWNALYRDHSIENGLNWKQIKERYKYRLEYETFLSKLEEEKKSADKNPESITTENIVKGRRTTQRQDYARLHEEVYGGLEESEDEDYHCQEEEEILDPTNDKVAERIGDDLEIDDISFDDFQEDFENPSHIDNLDSNLEPTELESSPDPGQKKEKKKKKSKKRRHEETPDAVVDRNEKKRRKKEKKRRKKEAELSPPIGAEIVDCSADSV